MPLLQEKQKGENVYQAMEFDGSDETYHLVKNIYQINWKMLYNLLVLLQTIHKF